MTGPEPSPSRPGVPSAKSHTSGVPSAPVCGSTVDGADGNRRVVADGGTALGRGDLCPPPGWHRDTRAEIRRGALAVFAHDEMAVRVVVATVPWVGGERWTVSLRTGDGVAVEDRTVPVEDERAALFTARDWMADLIEGAEPGEP